MAALKMENVGEKAGDTLSLKTGLMSQATKITENDEMLSSLAGQQPADRVAIEFLQK